MDQEISIGQASDASWLGECAGKWFVAKGRADYLNADWLTFGLAMMHGSNPQGHGTYFNTREEAESCLARYRAKFEPPKRELKVLEYECDSTMNVVVHLFYGSWVVWSKYARKCYWTGEEWASTNPKRFSTAEEAYAEWETKIKGKS